MKPTHLLVFLAVLLIFPFRSAHAYIDPGSGALIWQVVVAVFFGSLFYIRRIYSFLTTKLQGLKKSLTGKKRG